MLSPTLKRDILTPMKDFKIRRGTYPVDGQNANVWLVIDQKAMPQDLETIAGVLFLGDSGNTLVAAMVKAGAVKEDY